MGDNNDANLSPINKLTRSPYLQWVLVAIFVLAAATRFHDLALRSLWADEGWTLVLAKGPSLGDVFRRMVEDQHPPLYFALFHYWRDLTGSTEFAMRSLSVLLGLIAVAGIYQLGRILFGTTAGVFAALLLALSDHHIDLSQDVRHYTLLTTLFILSTWFFFRLVNADHTRRLTRIGYVLFSAGMLYTHYLSAVVLIMQVLYLLTFVRPFKRLWWVGFHWAAACAMFLPWLPVMIRQNQIRWTDPLHYQNALITSREAAIMVRDALLGKQYAIMGLLVIIGLVWVTYAGNKIKIRLRPVSPILFVFVWAAGHTAFIFYLNETRDFLTIRNLVIATPPLLLLAAHGLTNLQFGIQSLLVMTIVVVNLTTVDTRQLKPPWREVTQNVTDFHNEGEPILMDIWVGDFAVRYYIERQMGPDTEWLSIRETIAEQGDLTLPYLLGYIQDRDAFWLIYWGDEPSDAGYETVFEQAGFQRTASPYVDHVGNKLYSYRYDRVTEDVLTTYSDETGEIFALHKAAVNGEVKPGETITVTLWWTAEMPPAANYSVSVFLLDESGTSKAQHDGPPLGGLAQTSTWKVGRLQYDQHEIALPSNLPSGDYQLGVKVYYYQAPNNPLQTPCIDDPEDTCDWRVIDRVTVQ